MLDEKGFDAWSSEYDRAVEQSQNDGTYPFAGYAQVHDEVFKRVKGKASVLELGVGTGRFSKRLYDLGIAVTGVDFSENMLEIARRKMPNAEFIRADLTQGMPCELAERKFGAIAALYSIHHLTDAQKAVVINSALDMLDGDGAFIIGDVAFASEADRLAARERAGDEWDDEEYYTVAEKLAPLIRGSIEFKKISFCAGVCVITKKESK